MYTRARIYDIQVILLLGTSTFSVSWTRTTFCAWLPINFLLYCFLSDYERRKKAVLRKGGWRKLSPKLIYDRSHFRFSSLAKKLTLFAATPVENRKLGLPIINFNDHRHALPFQKLQNFSFSAKKSPSKFYRAVFEKKEKGI